MGWPWRERIDDDLLLRIVSASYTDCDYATLTRERLRQITTERGCDFATALLFDRIRREPRFAEFIAEIDRARAQVADRLDFDGKLLVAPAAFFRELPRFGGDGAAVRAAAMQHGIACELLPSESAGSVSRNACLIRDALEAETANPIIVVSLSKGAADLRLALAMLGSTTSNIRAWVQIGGLVRGSPLIDAIFGNAMRRTLLRGYLKILRTNLSVCSELTWRENELLCGPVALPDGIEVINVVGFPLARHVRGNTRRRYLEMRRLGPNDGSTLLVDAIVEPGLVYPLWGADHYFRVPEIPSLLGGLFRYLAQRLAQ